MGSAYVASALPQVCVRFMQSFNKYVLNDNYEPRRAEDMKIKQNGSQPPSSHSLEGGRW